MLRTEYPRPQFMRQRWQNLNGVWDFVFDFEKQGMKEKWFQQFPDSQYHIQVPFTYQTELSGIHMLEPCDNVWYRRFFSLEQDVLEEEKVLLHFGAVDYQAKVFLNGYFLGEHTGGQTPFSFNIKDYLDLSKTEQELILAIYDPLEAEDILRGKQFWEKTPRSIWYTPTTGIWQTVWLEYLHEEALTKYFVTPDVDQGIAEFILHYEQKNRDCFYDIQVSYEGVLINSIRGMISNEIVKVSLDIYQNKVFRGTHHGEGLLWTPETPKLLDVTIQTWKGEKRIDTVESYFGMRKIHQENGMIFLNNRPYYQRLVLDQGYWEKGLLTAPTDDDFKKDITLSKSLGFNGCRKHQKVEDPRFLYWADKLGYLVWGEAASAANFSKRYVKQALFEWGEIVERDYNHPCIVSWVPLNESWGVSEINDNVNQQHHAISFYHYLKSLDETRLVVNNDGWELTITDICAFHNYNHGMQEEKMKRDYFIQSLATKEAILHSMPAGRPIYVRGFKNNGEPIMLTEFGGIAFRKSTSVEGSWGYTSVEDEQTFLADLEAIMNAVTASSAIYGFCYTQLYDVEKEINGLLTYQRIPKASTKALREIFTKFHKNVVYE